MFITVYQDPDDFLLKTRAMLEQDEVTNSLILGIAASIKNSSLYATHYLATIEDENGLLIAACMTPPHNIILYGREPENGEPENEAAFTLLVQNLRAGDWFVMGVTGPVPVAENFARSWAKLTGQSYKVNGNQRLFVLERVIKPLEVSGKLRIATEDDLELIERWTAEFWLEALHEDDTAGAKRRSAMRVRQGDMYVWETPEKHLVSMVARTRPLAHTISVAMVYTPPAYRGKGYASNCVAAFSQLLLNQGKQSCNLFTDLANPISNSIYQKMGYRPVCDFDDYLFVTTPAFTTPT
jgi:predicted GNAT family acetyltransferase